MGILAVLTGKAPEEKAVTDENALDMAHVYDFINESQVVSDRMMAAVEEVNMALGQLRQIADQSVSEGKALKANSHQSMEQIQEAFARLQEVSATSEQIRKTAVTMSEESEEAKQSMGKVSDSLASTEAVMERLTGYNGSVTENIQGLTDHTAKIDEINTLIKGVVSQTSLLSLNASIEAARAGEHGKGFSVVAQEIKKLADQSSEAVERSSGILTAIEQGVEEVVASVEEERLAVAEGVQEVAAMKERVHAILGQITNVNDLVQETANDSESQAVMTNEATEQLEEVVDRVKDTLTYIDRTVDDMAAQQTQTTHLTAISEDLHAASTELTSSIRALDVEESVDVADADLEAVKELLSSIVVAAEIKGLDPAAHEACLTRQIERSDAVEAIWSNRADGSFIYSNPPAGLANARQRDWWKKAMDGEFFVSENYISAITKKPCITLSTAIKDEEGEPVGMVGMDVKLSEQ
ncbi:methyl-accepting chemotaxis protein [Salisediminibacterium selenitireducens]|uniref:Methyl-accepting chemotaxis sensory transducer n=1 Tax=Bacillus selenitireducens (strain ATCC 700615 / DSM 15326 / MLS10) TaxID=439292 RepID=D6XZH0_BACIE|nr:methyl-accepting chemotaxis protein [Salisediminibacterium selenitireducens]ADH98344.1 methyl-accepting chemotaxis sensory transducer [[Bacillus] selenitireducens MLS10]